MHVFESSPEMLESRPEARVLAQQLARYREPNSKPPRSDALRRAGLMVENCTYGQPYDQYAEST